MKFNDIIKTLTEQFKLRPQEKWDNSGLQIGNLNNEIKKIMLVLDLDKDSIKIAIDNNIDLIITHHPFIFSPIKSIDLNTYDGQIIQQIILNNINLYSMHTSFDMAKYGVNFELAKKLGLDKYDILHNIYNSNNEPYGYGGIADIEPINIIKYAEFVKDSLSCNSVRLFCNDDTKIIRRVAFCGGSGSDFIIDAINNTADVYITGDIKYHQAQDALKNNLFIIDAGHYNTEYHSLKRVQTTLKEKTAFEIMLLEKNTVPEIII